MYLDQNLWGYPKLVDSALRVKTRIRIIQEERTRWKVEKEKRESYVSVLSIPEVIFGLPDNWISSSTPVSQGTGDGRRTENIEHQVDDLEPCYAEVEPDDIQEIPCDGAEPNDQYSYPKVGGFRTSPSDSPSLAEESLTTTLPIGSDTNIPG